MIMNERPPILTGDGQRDIAALRDYLFRLAGSLPETAAAGVSAQSAGYDAQGRQMLKPSEQAGGDTDAVRKNADELKSLIIKSAQNLQQRITNGDNAVIAYIGRKEEEYGELYVAKSEYGDFTETINSRIETQARGVVESYGYGSAIQSMQDGIDLLQAYYTDIKGEIRRGIVLDPSTNQYVTGIAISQSLRFSGECGPADPLNPGDGYTYYYLTSGQTFGLYTATGWQFWIDGYKKGWFNSEDGMLHVANIFAEAQIVHGGYWESKTEILGGRHLFSLNYIGE